MKNNEVKTVKGLPIEAVPAYNIVHMRSPGNPFHTKILYPYHFGETDTSKLVDLLKDDTEIEVRIRDMQ